MANVKHRIGLGTVGNAIPNQNDITAKKPVETEAILTADRTNFTADSTVKTADGSYPFTADSTRFNADGTTF